MLIAAGADPNLPDTLQELPPILWAAGSGRLKTVDLLLSKGVDVNQKWGHNGDAALHVAVAHDRIQIVPLLIRHGANVDSANYLGETPLKLSCNEAMRKLLRSYGASK